jgi:hypothetical protein
MVLGFWGCDEQARPLVIPPPPLPQYLSHDLPPNTPAASTAESVTASSAEAAKPAAKDAKEAKAPPSSLPPDIAAQVKEVENAVERLQQQNATNPGGASQPLAPDKTPAIRPGERPVKVAVEVPMDATSPVKRFDQVPATTDSSGRVALTKVQSLPSAGEEAPLPPGQTPKKTSASPTQSGLPPLAKPAGSSTLDGVTKQYETLAQDKPADLEIARTLRFLYFLGGQDEKSLEALPGLSADEQKVWRGLMWALINARDKTSGMGRAEQAGEVLDAVEDVRETLQRQAPLGLGEVRFVERVKGYGNYDVVPTAKFQVKQLVWVYTEIKNFVAEKGRDGLYRVQLNERFSLENAEGHEVWQENKNSIEDVCRQPRQDFFMTTPFYTPAVPPGKYVLKLTIEDALGHKSVGAKLELEVGKL